MTAEQAKCEELHQAIVSKKVRFPDGTEIPALGQGTWHIGDFSNRHEEEVASLRLGIELGMIVIDTAEMYGDGASERLVGEAIHGRRSSVFLVSKALPSHAESRDLAAACEGSLRRLGTDYLDLYLLHWRGTVPLEDTIRGMEQLRSAGKILRWGVSNFDTDDMKQLWQAPGGPSCAANQVLYHLGSRGIEVDLLPWQRKQQLPLMAYSPLAEAGALKRRLLTDPVIRQIATAHQLKPLQLLLSWVIHQAENDRKIVLPKAGRREHLLENAEAAAIHLTRQEIAALDRAFPTPNQKVPLDIV